MQSQCSWNDHLFPPKSPPPEHLATLVVSECCRRHFPALSVAAWCFGLQHASVHSSVWDHRLHWDHRISLKHHADLHFYASSSLCTTASITLFLPIGKLHLYTRFCRLWQTRSKSSGRWFSFWWYHHFYCCCSLAVISRPRGLVAER